MRCPLPHVSLLALALCVFSATAGATATTAKEGKLIEAINAYRSELHQCEGQAMGELPPLTLDARLALSATGTGDLQEEIARYGYPMVTVQAISLSGPRDAQGAMKALASSFCQVLLDPQYVEIGITENARDWRIVLARPLLTGKLEDWQAEGRRLLEMINEARAEPRQCGTESFGAAAPLDWNPALALAAESHSRAMANGNFFSHSGKDGHTPGDRAELAGFEGSRVGENLAAAADTPRKVVNGWLTSPGHCANLMSPDFTELGAAYAVDPKSDAGIYWTAVFGGE